MKLKGKTLIELTDVNTGEVTSVEEENMVTNALEYFFNSNPMGAFYRMTKTYSYAQIDDGFLPICPNLVGGIMLFPNPLEENKDNLFPLEGNMPMGYASNDANPYADALRGSMNLNESMPITNGYRFVWDFATSQANGTIAAVALTSQYGGQSVYGNEFVDNTIFRTIKKDYITSLTAAEIRIFQNAVEFDAENEVLVSIMSTSTGIRIRKVRIPVHTIGLTDNLNNKTYEVLEDVTVAITNPIISASSYFTDAYFDGKDGYWYGFSNTTNSSGTATIYWYKISKSNYSLEEGVMKVSSCTLDECGRTYTTSSQIQKQVNSCVRDGYYYVLSYLRKAVYKIAIGNAADVTMLSLKVASDEDGISNNYNNVQSMILVNNIIIGREFRIMTDDTVVFTKGDYKVEDITTPMFMWRQFGIYWSSIYRNIAILTPFFATINNLSSAVEKTADKTMKITYTLTEEP